MYQAYFRTTDFPSCLATLPRSGLMRNGQVYSRPISDCRTEGSEHLLLPTPTASMGQRGWGLSLTGRKRYSEAVWNNAMSFGYKPPIQLLEEIMGFPRDFTDIEDAALGTQSPSRSQST
jgi:hypothetical protein